MCFVEEGIEGFTPHDDLEPLGPQEVNAESVLGPELLAHISFFCIRHGAADEMDWAKGHVCVLKQSSGQPLMVTGLCSDNNGLTKAMLLSFVVLLLSLSNVSFSSLYPPPELGISMC